MARWKAEAKERAFLASTESSPPADASEAGGRSLARSGSVPARSSRSGSAARSMGSASSARSGGLSGSGSLGGLDYAGARAASEPADSGAATVGLPAIRSASTSSPSKSSPSSLVSRTGVYNVGAPGKRVHGWAGH